MCISYHMNCIYYFEQKSFVFRPHLLVLNVVVTVENRQALYNYVVKILNHLMNAFVVQLV